MITFTRHSNATIAALFPGLGDLYEAVYSEPPYRESPEEVEGFRKRIPEESARRGFSLIAAEEGGRLIGAAYGWTMSAGKWWSRADQEPPIEIRDADKFAVMEWIVHPDRRRERIGSRLIYQLLTDRPESYATLASDPRSAAREIYRKFGWRQVAQSVLPWGPEMDILVIKFPTYTPNVNSRSEKSARRKEG
jgi:ribosomal protein S18 acetylase RimI-like enzyme